MHRPSGAPRGQVLVILAMGIIVLLGIAGIAIDVGRLMAERRHMQTAADAAALAACQSLKDGAVADVAVASMRARDVAAMNMRGAPSGTTGTMADPAVYDDEGGSGFLDADELTSGVVVSGTSVRVAIAGNMETMLARVVGVPTLGVGARARCTLIQEPALPIVVRRYDGPPGPGGSFKDVLATEATSTSGQVDSNPLGYNGRTPATDVSGSKGPLFEIYGPGSKAHNSSEFRGFINLDIRDFRDVTARDYYNGEEPGTNENVMKDEQAEYVIVGYPGPGFPAAVQPPTGVLQVATLSGHNTGHLVDAVNEIFDPGDRLMLAVYDGTVKAIPDFSITPPSGITLPATTSSPTDGPTFTVVRNDQFLGSVELALEGDEDAPTASDDIIPVAGTAAPGAGAMNEPVFNPNGFVFASGEMSRTVAMEDISTNSIAPGIYTVWVKGESNVPFKGRRHPIPVYVGGATKGFHHANSLTSGSAAAFGDTVQYIIRVRSENWTTGGSATSVALSWDPASLTDCILNPVTAPPGMTVNFSSASVAPGNGQGTASTMTVDTDGLASGCYLFNVRARATNADGQPVTRLVALTLYVVSEPTEGEYVEIIGFAPFEIDDIVSNTITGRAIGPICADPECAELRAVLQPRLVPWS